MVLCVDTPVVCPSMQRGRYCQEGDMVEMGLAGEPGSDPRPEAISAARTADQAGAEPAADAGPPLIQQDPALAADTADEAPKKQPREVLLDRFAAARRAQIENDIGYSLDAAPAAEEAAPPAKLAAPEAAPAAAAARLAAEPLFDFKVYGRVMKLPQGEILKLAQRGMSADERPAEATRLRAEAERLRTSAAHRSPARPTPACPAAAPAGDDGGRDPSTAARSYRAIRQFVELLARQAAREFVGERQRPAWTHAADTGAGSGMLALSTSTCT